MKKKNPVRSFEDLMVWQKGIEFVKKIYLLTGFWPEGPASSSVGLHSD